MLFSSNVFLFAFLPAVLLTYYLCPRRLRNPVLLLFSLFFYGWGEPVYLLLMIGDILLNYLCGRWMARSMEKGAGGKTALVTGIVLNLLLLGYFKYAGFFSGGLLPQVSLPIGISFYIFQSMSYLIDVYRGNAPVQRSVLTFGTYVSLFPQLIAGPIVRYADVAQMLRQRRENLQQFASGIQLFIVGLSKKVLLANPMGNLWNLLQVRDGTAAAWMGLLAYTMQIYFDFSGYSDMAIGLGRMFGFEFLENFNYPYISASVTEFWRRWHISLSTWFREYVYIPLGGNRKGLRRQIFNIAVVWLLTGLWHGASWNFVLWGGYYALLLILEKTFLLKGLEKAPAPVRHGYTMLAVMVGWALFYFEDLSALGGFLGRLFQPVSSAGAFSLMAGYLPLMAAAVLAATPTVKNLVSGAEDRAAVRYGRIAAAGVGLLLCVAALASQSYNPFIYFRF
ncbi:MAG: MBOAT family O-acyltransferase [Faecousia sp.]